MPKPSKSPWPRLWTPPLHGRTPRATEGHKVVRFAGKLGIDLMPWQQWTLIHGLERLPNGLPRFQTVLVLVARQNGKTTILQVLSLYQMVHGIAKLVLGTSTNQEYARHAWRFAVELAEHKLVDQIEQVRHGTIDTSLTLRNGAQYRIASASRRGGRSLSVDLGILDELREHYDFEAWAAISGATTAKPHGQIWALSNAGDDRSVVLNHLRDMAKAKIETGEGDPTLGLFEWSAPDDCDLADRKAWRQANPALGYTVTEATLAAKLATSPAAVFRTEHLTQRVVTLDAAVDLQAWKELADGGASLDGYRDRVALCLDMAWDSPHQGQHLTLVAAAVDDEGRVRAEVVDAWESPADARADLPKHLEKIKPQAFGWFPNGPAASLAAELKGVRNAEELKSAQQSAVCMGLAEQVSARRVLHTGDPLLLAQVQGVSRSYSGDGWTFTRKGAGHCDAVYALAGAVHLARTLRPKARPMVLVGRKPAA